MYLVEFFKKYLDMPFIFIKFEMELKVIARKFELLILNNMKSFFSFLIISIILLNFTSNKLFSNNIPVFTSVPNTYILEFSLYNYQITAFDIDNDSIIFFYVDKPEWLTLTYIDKSSAKLSGSTMEYFDSISVELGITDEIDTIYQSFYLHLTCINEIPQIITSPVLFAYVDSVYEYQLIGTDVNCNVSFQSILLPRWLNLTNNSQNGTKISGTPAINDTGTYNITVEVFRECEICDTRAIQSYNLKVKEFNSIPVFNSVPITIATFDETYRYEISGIDNDDDTLLYYAEKIPDWLSLTDNKNNTAILEGTPHTITDYADTSVVICITDKKDTVKQSYNIKIYCVPVFPIIISVPDTIAIVGEEYIYNFEVSNIEIEPHIINCIGFPQSFSFEQFDNYQGRISGIPSSDDIGLYVINCKCEYSTIQPCYDPSNQIYNLRIATSTDLNILNIDKFKIKVIENKWLMITNENNTDIIGNIQIIDMTGEVIFSSSNVIDNEFNFDIGKIGPGVYIVLIGKDGIHYNSYKILLK